MEDWTERSSTRAQRKKLPGILAVCIEKPMARQGSLQPQRHHFLNPTLTLLHERHPSGLLLAAI
jgi:hypothetical protein